MEVLNEMKITKKNVSENQGGFRKGNECLDHIIALKMRFESTREAHKAGCFFLEAREFL